MEATSITRPVLRTSEKSKAIEETLLQVMQELDGNIGFPTILKISPA